MQTLTETDLTSRGAHSKLSAVQAHHYAIRDRRMTAREERGERAESARHGRQRRRAEVVSPPAAQSPARHTDGSAATPMRARSSRAPQLAQAAPPPRPP